jgi:hypothetical protein
MRAAAARILAMRSRPVSSSPAPASRSSSDEYASIVRSG